MRVKECDGDCEKHEGEVIEVIVIDVELDYNWGGFNYCENAIIKDMDRGYEVKKKNEIDKSE